MQKELKPCPLCEGKAELDFAHNTFSYFCADGAKKDSGFYYIVKCTICNCKSGIFEDPTMAIEAWNKRASNPQWIQCSNPSEPDTASMQSENTTEIQKILDYLDNELHPLVSPDNWSVYSELYDMVSELKTLSPSSQRKKGKWVNANDEKWNTVEVLKCSVCGEIDNRMYRTDKFCPNCGAEME